MRESGTFGVAGCPGGVGGGTRTFALRPRSELARDVSAQVPKRVGGIERWGYVHC